MNLSCDNTNNTTRGGRSRVLSWYYFVILTQTTFTFDGFPQIHVGWHRRKLTHVTWYTLHNYCFAMVWRNIVDCDLCVEERLGILCSTSIWLGRYHWCNHSRISSHSDLYILAVMKAWKIAAEIHSTEHSTDVVTDVFVKVAVVFLYVVSQLYTLWTIRHVANHTHDQVFLAPWPFHVFIMLYVGQPGAPPISVIWQTPYSVKFDVSAPAV